MDIVNEGQMSPICASRMGKFTVLWFTACLRIIDYNDNERFRCVFDKTH